MFRIVAAGAVVLAAALSSLPAHACARAPLGPSTPPQSVTRVHFAPHEVPVMVAGHPADSHARHRLVLAPLAANRTLRAWKMVTPVRRAAVPRARVRVPLVRPAR